MLTYTHPVQKHLYKVNNNKEYIREEFDNNTVTVWDFNTPLTSMNK